MSKTFAEMIEWANSRGVGQFHVFCDKPVYAGKPLVHVGKHQYSTTWNSFAVAVATAKRQTNGKVYNSEGRMVFCA